ncbi:MAG: zinc ribbon domain-containing protein [Methanobrevibacter sp.]|nr:zinc ribbon domain-containing protein [Methanobrevibacter sp.]
MKCEKCGEDIKSNAKFCPNCGSKINNKPATNIENNTNINLIIIAITAIIVIAIIAFTACYIANPFNLGESNANTYGSNDQANIVNDNQASEVQSTESSKSWQSVGSFEGSGSGTKTITVPAGQIRIDLSAYPIKNYATNHLYVSGSNGQSAKLDWGPKSAVATHSDSISFTSSSQTTFTIDYYETVSWHVTVYKYQ